MSKGVKEKEVLWRDFIAYSLIVIFILYFVFLSIGRHNALKSFQNDLGTYAQMTWNTLHGRFFEASGAYPSVTITTPGQTLENFNYLSAHFSPILLFFVPFYAIWPDPKIFLIIQAVAVGLSALPIYWLAKELIKISWAGLAFLASYLLYPLIHNAVLYDFHEVTIAVPLVTFFLWFWHKKKYGLMFLFLFLLLLCQEHISLIIFMFGLYLFIFQKKRKLGFSIALISLLYFFIILFVVIPKFSLTGSSVIINAGEFKTRYSWLGTSFSEIVNKVISQPLFVLKYIFGPRQMDFLIILILPTIGLSLFSPLFLLLLPMLLINFLSSFAMTFTIYFYQSVMLSGIIYFSAIMSFAKMVKIVKWQKIYLLIIIFTSLAIGIYYSVSPLSAKYSFRDYQPSENAMILKEIKTMIPANASISVQHNLGPHFVNRRKLFQFPFNIDKADFVILDIYDQYQGNENNFSNYSDAFIGAQEFDTFLIWLDQIDLLFENRDFGVIYNNNGWLVFKRGASSEANEGAKIDFQKALMTIKVK